MLRNSRNQTKRTAIDKSQPIYKSRQGKDAILAVYDRLLEEWTVPYEAINIPTQCGRTFVIACGEKSAPPLILLHGSSFNSLMWMADMRKYCGSFRVYAADLPGEPGKSEDVRYRLDTPEYAGWMTDIIDHLGIQKVSIAGISLGGWMALKFAVNHPERIEKLVLLSTSGIGPQKSSFLFRVIPLMMLGERGVDRLIKLVNGSERMHEDVVEYSKLIARNFNPRISVLPIFTDDELRRLTMPVYVISGEKDIMLHSKKTIERARKLFVNAKTELLPDTGHSIIHCTDRIVDFLTA